MKFLSRLVAIVLIAWLPILGYPATGSACPAMFPVSDIQARHACNAQPCKMVHDTKTHIADASAACRTTMGGLSCGIVFMASVPLTFQPVAAPSPYAPRNSVLITQYAPEPLQRPPRAA
ncbi:MULTISPECIES: hypothetical protein [Burkholderia]|jgi:hypothetical protein|uniref:Lipoprotein n=2 Tax=Burkholderia contaminans TaxID=488447 RepID=A0AAP1VD39_9BURK|nr:MULTISPECIES: hypothetical protein [Burkholderia]EKS9800580.1 hypothetical protein [Burkholderia cepacia]EKS9807803.1 hypothetical protein [Burkholderia cepacia]EKS9815403.1 hypothetical protein [Burkholderia cepacia]EKS9821928.1 hypothetical protein [Burkholderia cepacia]EKS9839163.1 hypothetical protein [Burkholderia cepacia]